MINIIGLKPSQPFTLFEPITLDLRIAATVLVIEAGPGILLTNSPGRDLMSEIGLAYAGSNEASRQIE